MWYDMLKFDEDDWNYDKRIVYSDSKKFCDEIANVVDDWAWVSF